MRNPKPPIYTDEEEARLSQTEAIMSRARIMERGVAEVLKQGEYSSAGEIEVCAAVLTEAVNLRIDAEMKRAAIRAAAMARDPNRTRNRVRRVIA